LKALAHDVLDEKRIAQPITVQRLLREVVEEVLGSANPQGVG
jgi:hypothetical protein